MEYRNLCNHEVQEFEGRVDSGNTFYYSEQVLWRKITQVQILSSKVASMVTEYRKLSNKLTFENASYCAEHDLRRERVQTHNDFVFQSPLV